MWIDKLKYCNFLEFKINKYKWLLVNLRKKR